MNLPTLSDIYVPACRVSVGEMPLPPELSAQIRSISVSLSATPPSTFTLQVDDPGYQLLDPVLSPFVEGKMVEIEMGYVNRLTSVITGEITALDADFTAGAMASITTHGMDLAHRLSRGTTVRQFPAEMDVAQILRQVAAEVGLPAEVDAVEVPPTPYSQEGITNRELVEMLVQQHNLYYWVEGQTLYFKQQRRTANTVQLELGKDLLTYSANLSTVGQVNTVMVRDRDEEKAQLIQATTPPSTFLSTRLSLAGRQMVARGAGGGAGGSQRVLINTSAKTRADAEALAKALLRQQERGFLSGSGSTPGNTDIGPDTHLDLRGLGRFSGIYLVTQVTHTLNSSGFTTSFEAACTD